MAVNPYQTYKQQSILTMTHGEMLNKLYEEVVKQLGCAEVYIEQKDYEKVNHSLQKAQRIINHLRGTLDFQYDISNNLDSLYDFFLQQIISSNVHKDPKPIHDIIPMVKELQETFIEADRLARKQ